MEELYNLASEILFKLHMPEIHIHFVRDDYFLGAYNHECKMIRINISGIHSKGIVHTLLHEIGHYIQFYRHPRWVKQQGAYYVKSDSVFQPEVELKRRYRIGPGYTKMEANAEALARALSKRFAYLIWEFDKLQPDYPVLCG